MNFPLTEISYEQRRSRQWTPLITQQLRLRHLYRVTAYNIVSRSKGSFYFTLHMTTMCAPFYTSEKIDSSCPKWTELNVPNSSAKACVLRIWQTRDNEMDNIILTWGVNFSGLVHLGNNIANVQPSSFKENSVILYLRGGLFASINTLRTDLQSYMPFIDSLNVISTEESTKIYRNESFKVPSNDVRKSYNIDKLRKLQSLQFSIRNRSLDVLELRDKISRKCLLCRDGNFIESPNSPGMSPDMSSSTDIRYAPQLLTMSTLNKMLQEKPTKLQEKEIIRIRKEIELAKFKTKLLSQERDKKTAHIRYLKQTYTKLLDENQETSSQLMEKYRHLSKEIEKLRVYKDLKIHQKETLLQYKAQLHHRRRQLLSQLLFLYPIEPMPDKKYKICDIIGPSLFTSDSETYILNDNPVVLGYVAHILVMCSSFLQVPLCYPIVYMGSRSVIIDPLTPSLGETKTEYPLFLRGKDSFIHIGFWLLNKNITQLCWLYNMKNYASLDMLHNLLLLLKGKDYKPDMEEILCSTTLSKRKVDLSQKLTEMSYLLSQNNSIDPILDLFRFKCENYDNVTVTKTTPSTGLSEILSKQYALGASPQKSNLNEAIKQTNSFIICDIKDGKCINSTDLENVEQGTDLLDPSVHLNIDNSHNHILTTLQQPHSIRTSRSVGSYTDDESEYNCVSSDPILNCSVNVTLENSTDDLLQNVEGNVSNGGSTDRDAHVVDENCEYESFSPLTLRTSALLNTTSFNLVKPKL